MSYFNLRIQYSLYVIDKWFGRGGEDGNLHFPVPSMKRLNQTEPATFSILPCWAFFRDSVFIYSIGRKSVKKF
jgi:hypothetical protein